MLAIRPAEPFDVPIILELIHELATYEREPHAVIATEADLLRDGFGQRPFFHCLIAEENGEPAGFAFYFFNYSTWRGRPGIHLEDLFVRPGFRGGESAKLCWPELPRSRSKTSALACNGTCSTGTRQPSISTIL